MFSWMDYLHHLIFFHSQCSCKLSRYMIEFFTKTDQSVPARRTLSMRVITLVAVIIGFGILAPASTPTQAAISPGSMDIEKKHIFASRLIKDYLERRHYRRVPLDDDLSERVLDRFLEVLDPDKLYFLQQDIDKFNEIRFEFDDFLRHGQLEPAFAIFHVYRTRLNRQIDVARKLLSKNFNFDRDEQWLVDREQRQWAENSNQLNELWRKRVKNDLLSLVISGKKESEARETLATRYKQLGNRTEQLNADDVFQFYINAYLTTVEPHTSYLSPRASENFKIRMSLSLEGIGAVLQTDNEHTLVRSVVPGGPADLSSQLHSGDRIVGVGQGTDNDVLDVIGWRLDDVVDLIRGPKGSIVQLRVLPEKAGLTGESKVVVITRDKIKLEEQAAKKSILEFDHDGETFKFGVIDVPTFYADFEGRAKGDPQYRSTTKDVRRLIDELAKESIDALIVDLRGNGGGALSEAISLTGLFIESGPIVQVRDTTGHIKVNMDPDPSVAYTGPLAVMVDRSSASASEIFAGAIQDYHRGLILGEPTFGKGTVQNLVNLSRHSRNDTPLGQLKLTVAQFFRINGESTQHRGVVPDIQFPTALDSQDKGERAYENALPWTKIKPADYDAYLGIGDSATLAHLLREFDARKDSTPGLRYIQEAEAFGVKNRNLKSISLLESKRRAEREQREEESTSIENRLRVALGVEIPSDEEKDEEETASIIEDSQKRPDFPPDILLEEAGHILANMIRFVNSDSALVDSSLKLNQKKN